MNSFINVFDVKKEVEDCIDLSVYSVEEFIDRHKRLRYMGETRRYIEGEKSLVVLYYEDDKLDRVIEYPYSQFKSVF